MSKIYYYSDIRELIDNLTGLGEQIEFCVQEMVDAGLRLGGFEGEAADMYKTRFHRSYTNLKSAQTSIQETTYEALDNMRQIFKDVESSTDAVIYHDRLAEYDTYVDSELSNLLDEISLYNQAISLANSEGVDLEYLPSEIVSQASHDLITFTTLLRDHLEEADETASALLENLYDVFAANCTHREYVWLWRKRASVQHPKWLSSAITGQGDTKQGDRGAVGK